MDNQEPPLSPDFPVENPPEIQDPKPKTQKLSNETSSSFCNDQNHRHATKMGNFKALFFNFAILSSPTESLSPIQRSIIEQRLHDFFPDFHTPDHPPYAAMIETSIGKLNEEGGSTEEAISQFIRNEYPDLPWAHDILLKHHLQNLCKDGGVVKNGNRFSMQNDVVTDHNPDQFLMVSHVATHIPIASPTSDIGDESSPDISLSSSTSWCSSTSSESFPSPNRKRPYVTWKKRGRKRGRPRKRTAKRNRIFLKRSGKRRRRSRKKDVVEEEIEILMFEEPAKESNEQSPRRGEGSQVAEGHNKVRRKRPRTRMVLETDLDQIKAMVNEEWRGQHPQEKSVCRTNNQAEDLEKEECSQAQAEVNSKFELQLEAKVEAVGQEAQLKNGQKAVTTQKDTAKEEHQVIVEVEETCLIETKIEVMAEQRLLEEHAIEVVRCDGMEQKRRARTCKGTAKRRQVNQKRAPVPGRGRRRKKDLLVEEIQANSEEMEATDIQDITLQIQDIMIEEKNEVTKEESEVNKQETLVVDEKNLIKKDGRETSECSQAKEMQKEIKSGKPTVIEEENESKLHNSVAEEKPQRIGGVKRCDGQEKHENIIDMEPYESGELKNEVSEEQNKPQRQQNGEQKMQVEKNIEQEVEVAELQYQNLQIQQKIHLDGEHEEIAKRLLAADDTVRNIDNKETMLPAKLSSPVFEEKAEEISKKNVEWEKESPGELKNAEICSKHTQQKPEFPTSEMSSKLESVEILSTSQFMRLPGPVFEEKKEMPMKNVEQRQQSPGDEGNVQISGKHTQQKPEFSSSELSQPELLQQLQQAEEKPGHQRLWHRLLKSFSLS